MTGRKLALYTRAGCHLCESMLAEMQPYLIAADVRLELVDIDEDPVLVRRYGADVPVLLSQHGELCRHRLDHVALRTYLNDHSA